MRIVRERFHKTELQTEAEYVAAKDAFLSELYTYLIGQANRAMHDAFTEAVALSTGAVSTAEASRAASVKGSVISLILQAASRPDGRLPSESKEGRDETEAELDRLGRIAQESEHTGGTIPSFSCVTRITQSCVSTVQM